MTTTQGNRKVLKFESFVQKAARAAHASVLRNRWMLDQGTRYGEEMARTVARDVRAAFKEAK